MFVFTVSLLPQTLPYIGLYVTYKCGSWLHCKRKNCSHEVRKRLLVKLHLILREIREVSFQMQASRSLMNIQTAETKVRPRSSFYFLLQRVLIRWFSGFCTRVMFNHIQLHICGKILPTIRKAHLPHSGSFLLTVLNINGTFTAFDYHCCNLILRCWYTLMSVRQRERKRYRERDSGKGGKGMDTLLWLFLQLPFSEIQPRGWMPCPSAVREIPEVIYAGFILPVKQ